jgi:hypothetical protein
MTRGKSALGVLAISVLAVCAFGASNASAYTIHECAELVGTGVKYTDGSCSVESGTGKWQTVARPANTPFNAQVTPTSNFVLSATVGGVNFAITCTGLEAPGLALTNKEEAGSMFVTSTSKSKFTGCSVTAPKEKGCTVPAAIETVELKSKTDASGNTKYEPSTGTKFVTIPVTKCSTEALNGEKEVTGTAQSSRKTASTQAFTATSGSALKFGGQAATFTGEYHSATLAAAGGQTLGLELP